MSLRPYQTNAVDEIRQIYASGERKVLLKLATGAGKTVIFSHIVRSALDKGRRSAIITRGRKIVGQASARLSKEGVPHGVMMGSHALHAPHRFVQVCSITTLYTRKIVPKADIVVIDEAHFATAPEFHWAIKEFEAQNPNVCILAVTATPYTRKPLRHLANKIVAPISTQAIIEAGFLVDARYFAPSEPDLSGVRIRAGDYVETDLNAVMSRTKIIGDLVENYKKYSNELSALCFCVSIAHATLVCQQFNEAGIPAVVLHADSPDDVRDDAIRELEHGPLKVICNVGVMGVGVDIPWLRTVILARPTKSLNLYLQQIGRGSRPYPGKEKYLVLDHASNVRAHGFMTDEHEANLDGYEPDAGPRTRTCKACFAIYNPLLHPQFCPACGVEWRVEARGGGAGVPEAAPGTLVELKPGDAKKARVAAPEEAVVEALQRLKYHLEVLSTQKKQDGTPFSPWSAFYKVKTEMAGKIDEEALVRLFRGQAKAMGFFIGKSNS